MATDSRIFMVVQPGAAQGFVIDIETQWLDQMELCPGIGTHADDIPGIGRNFRLKENYGNHGVRPILKTRIIRETGRGC